MNHSNKKGWTIAIIFLLIILFSLTLRIDLNNSYPKGVDTYDLYSLSRNVQEKEYVVWNIDFMTAIGMTSFSYPSGGIIFLAEMSSLTGLSMTDFILIWNVIFIIIAALIVYLTANEIFKNNAVALLTAAVYLNARFFIAYSTFYTSRNILHIFFLATIFLIIKKIDFKNIFLVIFFLVMSFATHRATVLIGVFILAFIISRIAYKYYKNNLFQNSIIALAGLFMFLVSVYLFGHSNIGSETTRIPIEVGIQYIDDLLSIIFTITMHFGILTLLLPAGYFFLITKKDKNKEDLFILTSITLSAGFAVETIYFFYLFLPILALLTAYFLMHIISSHKKIFNITIVFIIIALIIPIYVTITESNSDVLIVKQQTLKLISFLDKSDIQKSVICNNHVVYCTQISSLSKNVNALTHTSVRTLIDNILIENRKFNIFNIRSKIIVKDNIIGTALFSDTYTSAIINWNTPKPIMDKLLKFTNVRYIIDSNNPDAIANKVKINNKFGRMNQIYDNGLQQVKEII
jgi:hypothetical protein